MLSLPLRHFGCEQGSPNDHSLRAGAAPAALHNEQVITHLLADPGGMVRTHSRLTPCLRRHTVMWFGLNGVIWTAAISK